MSFNCKLDRTESGSNDLINVHLLGRLYLQYKELFNCNEDIGLVTVKEYKQAIE